MNKPRGEFLVMLSQTAVESGAWMVRCEGIVARFPLLLYVLLLLLLFFKLYAKRNTLVWAEPTQPLHKNYYFGSKVRIFHQSTSNNQCPIAFLTHQGRAHDYQSQSTLLNFSFYNWILNIYLLDSYLIRSLCSWGKAYKIHKMYCRPLLFSHAAVVMKSWSRHTCSCYWSSRASGDSSAWLLHRSVILSVMATNKHTCPKFVHGHNNNVAADVENSLTASLLLYFTLPDRFSFTVKQFACTHGI